MNPLPNPPQPSARHKALRGGALLFASKAVAQACAFVRNIILARALGVENFGIAAMFSITVAILDMLGSLSVDQMLIQAKDGDSEKLQSTAHALQATRGLVSGLLLLVLAGPMAGLFGVPEAVGAFRWLALIPVLRGLVHLDQKRLQREMSYGQAVGLDLARELITTLLTWPLAIWLKDYSAMLWLLLIQGVISTIGSFLLAKRKYRWHWSREYSQRFFRFGWPLVANSVLLFGIYQGDRFLIGAAGQLFDASPYSLSDLGVYSVALSITLMPTLALGSICSSLMLPLFASVQSSPSELTKRYDFCSQAIALLSGLFALPLIVAGGWLTTTIYGRDYAAAGEVIGWLAAMQAIRMARLTPTVAAMAVTDTTNALYANIVRSLALVATLFVIATGGALKWVAIAGCGGELIGWLFCIWKLSRDHAITQRISLLSNGPVLVYLGGSGLLLLFIPESVPLRLLLLAALLIVFVVGMLTRFPALRSLVHWNTMRSFASRPGKVAAPSPVSTAN